MKISNSSLNIYKDCPLKYKLHYSDKLRSITTSSALLYGNALDAGLNKLLSSKSLEEALNEFNKKWETQEINYILVDLKTSNLVKYTKKDYDEELFVPFELQDIPEEQLAWFSLKKKGEIAIKAYNSKILPRITSVVAIQKAFNIDNADGDSITGFIDAILEIGGKLYVIDHKSASKAYEKDSAGKSQQLITYYYSEKDKYKLDGVGYIVLYKDIIKHRKKTCLECGHVTSEGKHTTCNNVVNKKRCQGEWKHEITGYDCDIDLILNKVESAEEDRVIEDFDNAVVGIKAEEFYPNKEACIGKFGKCVYYDLCHKGSEEGLMSLKKENALDK